MRPEQQHGLSVGLPAARLAVAAFSLAALTTKAADARFKGTMTSDQVERPVEETESTHFVVQGK